jgi:regulator of protease activity HflC (stomatin/prohibitin superfamily)
MERFRRAGAFVRTAASSVLLVAVEVLSVPWRRVALCALLLGAAFALKPPVASVPPGEVGVRVNHLTGGTSVVREGPALLVPFVHSLHRYPMRDQIYRPQRSAKAAGEAPFQSVEGLSLGVEVTVRYALDPDRVAAIARRLPEDVGRDLIEPVVDGVLYRALSGYTVREIFTSKRAEVQKKVEDELRVALAPDGVVVRALFLGNVDLPAEYRRGLEGMLAEELQTEKMRFTLELKAKAVKQAALDAEARKVSREKEAEAAALEEVIAAKGKADAMKHVLPLKRKQIEQRKLEAQARKAQRVMDAEGEAEARKIESAAEAEARKKLADADAYRLEVTGKADSDKLARDSQLIAQNPLLIQKAVADKLSDKVQVIVAPEGSPIGETLLWAKRK